MKKILQMLSAVTFSAIFLSLGGCSSNGGSAPAAPYSQAAHDALAQQFIAAATAQGLGYTLVKADTQQQGYIVVKTSTGVLEAFYVDGWTPGTSVASFAPVYTGLAPAGGNTYTIFISQGYENIQWVSSGYWTYDFYGNAYWVDTSYYADYGWVDTSYTMAFEVVKPTSKDLEKIAAFQQAYDIQSSALKVQKKFGLSLERASEVAKLAIQVKNTPKMSTDDYDSLSQQLLGVPVAKLDRAIQSSANNESGASSEVDDIINQAASTNGVGPEQARQLLNSMTGSGATATPAK